MNYLHIIIVILFLSTSVMSYLLWAFVRKNKTILKYCEMYVQLLGVLAMRMKQTQNQMKEIDRIGSFEADDETGYAFKELDNCITDLNNFIERYVNTEETKEKEN